MKTFLSLLSLLSLAGLLMTATTGCEVETRGGYYGPHEYGHEHFYYHHDRDWDDYHHGGYWDRGHYYSY